MFSEKQIYSIIFITACLFLFSVCRIYANRQAINSPAEQNPFIVYEIKGIAGNEGFYFFDNEMTLGEIMAYNGIPEFVSETDRYTFLRQGSRIVVEDRNVAVENMDAHALISFFLPIPLNSCSANDLTAIPGIGIKTAEAIIELRQRKKRIENISCLLEIRGIGEKRLNSIKPYITLD